MVETQTLMAVLAGGPYGPSDGVGAFNKSLLLRSCRSDGVLLKADKPVTMMEPAFAALPFDGPVPPNCSGPAAGHPSDLTCMVINVWSTHADIPGAGRYGFVLGLDLVAPFTVAPADFIGEASGGDRDAVAEYQVVEYWHGMRGDRVVVATDKAPFRIVPPPLSLDPAIITHAYYVFAPVLPTSGWCYLGEPGKIVTASARRVEAVSEPTNTSIQVRMVGSPGEVITVLARGPSGKLYEASCAVSELSHADPADTIDGKVGITCGEPHGCVCHPQQSPT